MVNFSRGKEKFEILETALLIEKHLCTEERKGNIFKCPSALNWRQLGQVDQERVNACVPESAQEQEMKTKVTIAAYQNS
jgi:hypothetical protein